MFWGAACPEHHHNMDEPWEHAGKWKKPDTKGRLHCRILFARKVQNRQIPRDRKQTVGCQDLGQGGGKGNAVESGVSAGARNVLSLESGVDVLYGPESYTLRGLIWCFMRFTPVKNKNHMMGFLKCRMTSRLFTPWIQIFFIWKEAQTLVILQSSPACDNGPPRFRTEGWKTHVAVKRVWPWHPAHQLGAPPPPPDCYFPEPVFLLCENANRNIYHCGLKSH